MEIIDAILRTATPGATKTGILYGAYLSYSQLKVYLNMLEMRQLIRFDAQTGTYMITDKGLRFLNTFDEIRDIVSPREGEGSPNNHNEHVTDATLFLDS